MKKNIFGFDVTVKDVMLVHVLNCSTDLSDDVLHCPLVDFHLVLEFLEEVATHTRLQYHVGTLLIHEEMVELADIGVVQERLNLDLSHQLLQLFVTYLRSVK